MSLDPNSDFIVSFRCCCVLFFPNDNGRPGRSKGSRLQDLL